MVKIEKLKPLIEEKHALMRLDKELSESGKKRLAELNKIILEESMKFVNEINPRELCPVPKEKELTNKEARKILKEKYDLYLERQRIARGIVNDSVKLKRQGQELSKLLVGKKSLDIVNKETLKLIERY